MLKRPSPRASRSASARMGMAAVADAPNQCEPKMRASCYVHVRARALVLVPRHEPEAALRVRLRLQQLNEAPLGERAHPAVLGDGVALVVVALDGDDGDAGVLQEVESGDGVVHRLRVNVAAVEEVAGDEDEINAVRDGVRGDYLVPGPEKILRALLQVVAAAAQMYVREMQEFHRLFFLNTDFR